MYKNILSKAVEKLKQYSTIRWLLNNDQIVDKKGQLVHKLFL